jgi:3'-phosphoadenosine 5'-phosphosulfate (PAPS) 3'-phosphatase
VLQAAGGAHDCEPGKPVRYNKEQLLNPHFVVYGKVGTEHAIFNGQF